jgi:nucleotide-binding universal stress UspA family protein
MREGSSMDRFESILWPTDFSKQARRALPWVNGMARRFAARVKIVHVVSPTVALVSMTGHATTVTNAYFDEMKQHAIEALEGIARQDIASDVSSTTEVLVGSPAREIASVAEREGIDLIIMATHGETGLMRLVTGSGAEKVVRFAPCPVLSVPPDGSDE